MKKKTSNEQCLPCHQTNRRNVNAPRGEKLLTVFNSQALQSETAAFLNATETRIVHAIHAEADELRRVLRIPETARSIINGNVARFDLVIRSQYDVAYLYVTNLAERLLAQKLGKDRGNAPKAVKKNGK